jgi:DNA-binding NarL/FixJ family response regulator
LSPVRAGRLMSTVVTPDAHERPGSKAGTLGVVLIDTPQVVRAGIALLLSSQADMEVLVEEGEAASGLEAIRRLRRRRAVVAMVGLGLAGERDSFWLIRSLRDQLPSLPILACAANADDSTVSRALFAGADGFVDKDTKPKQFVDAVRRTAAGDVVLTGVRDGPLAVEFPEAVAELPKPVLTGRELEVLTVASLGLTARQIGNRIGVRERTVTTHLGRIYRKLGAGSRVAAIMEASRSGLVSVSGPSR